MSALPVLPPLSPELAPVVELRPAADRTELEVAVVAAERAIDEQRHADAVAVLAGSRAGGAYPDFALRALLAESWALLALGEVDGALAAAERARILSEQPAFDDADRAEALYRLGCCRLRLSSTAAGISLLTLALELAGRSPRASDRLRARILEWRSRGYQRQRDWDAARNDVERGLELADAAGDSHTLAHLAFQGSIVAERSGQLLLARCYAEQARDLYESHGDAGNAARVLNNLGGISFLLGDTETAIAHLKQAVAGSLDASNDADAAQAISSLAQVHLRSDAPDQAEEQARLALRMLGGRVDFLDEIGNAQLVLGRSLLEQGRFDDADAEFRAAGETFSRLGSASHRAAALVARGDLETRRGAHAEAAALYRSAADELQDFRF